MLKSFGRETDHNVLLEAMEADGAIIIDDFLSPGEVENAVRGFSAYSETTEIGTNVEDSFQADFYGKKTKRFTGLVAKNPRFQSVVLDPLYKSICDKFLLNLCGEYRINTAEMIEVFPGAPLQYVHRDGENWPEAAQLGELMVASIVALTDFTAENGATRVVPGSHKWPTDRRPEDSELVPAVMPEGAAVIYLGSTLHGAGANMTSHAIRNSFHLSFCLGWLRTEENHYVATPFDLVPQLAPRTRQLLGFTTYKPKVMPAGLLGLKDCEDISPLFAPDREVEPGE